MTGLYCCVFITPKAAWYLVCFACLALIIWRPDWSLWVGTIESLLSLSIIILSMGVRVMSPNEAVLLAGGTIVTVEEVMNFMIVGGITWLSWTQGMKAIQEQLLTRMPQWRQSYPGVADLSVAVMGCVRTTEN